jgi:ABC-type glutathione transport system ATPase component
MNTPSSSWAAAALPLPTQAQDKLRQLEGKRDLVQRNRKTKAGELEKVTAYLDISDAVDQALDKLSEQLFGRIVKILEEKLTLALQEVLEQPIVLKVNRDYKRGGATISFHIERNGQPEDILKGQGGSVVNILSVGLRMFALTTLNTAVHRRFLVLDEQDCWLRPDLVPRLVKIVHEAGRALGFQVLLISHHDVSAFEQYADKIYQFIPTVDGVQVKERVAGPLNPDE